MKYRPRKLRAIKAQSRLVVRECIEALRTQASAWRQLKSERLRRSLACGTL
jgi:hypothetical protein